MRTVSIYNMADTWNAGSTTFDAIKMDVTDTASASGSRLLNLLVAGTSKIVGRKDGRLSALSFALGNTDADSPDLFLVREAADTLAMRNSTTAQKLYLYNTYTDTSNYERGQIYWASNYLNISTNAAGTGSTRGIAFGTGGTFRWEVSTSGHLNPWATNTYDLGSSGSKIRNAYYGGLINYNMAILPIASGLTLASDAITVTGSHHTVDTEGAAATDNLATISTSGGTTDGQMLLLRIVNGARVVTVKHGTGNIRLDGAADFVMNSTLDYIYLIFQTANNVWCEIGRGNNGS